MKRILLAILCCMMLCGCGASHQEKEPAFTAQSESTLPVTTDATSPQDLTTITVYIPNENVDGFETVDISGKSLSFLEAMVQAGVLPENIVINSFSRSDDTLTVDFGPELRELICKQGTTGEYMIMGSIVNTLITLNDVKYIMITVDGEILESGHVVYDLPMEFFP